MDWIQTWQCFCGEGSPRVAKTQPLGNDKKWGDSVSIRRATEGYVGERIVVSGLQFETPAVVWSFSFYISWTNRTSYFALFSNSMALEKKSTPYDGN